MGRVQLKRRSASGLALEAGEPNFDMTTHKFYVGDGSTNTLIGPYDDATTQNAQVNVYNVLDYGAVGDAQTITDAVIQAATKSTLECATNRFMVGDVGKLIVIMGAGTDGAEHITTIATYVSAGVVTLTDAAITAVTELIPSFTAYWGTDDYTAIQTAISACAAAAGGIVFFPCRPTAYAITSGLAVPSGHTGVRIEGRGSGGPFNFPRLLWMGAEDDDAAMITANYGCYGFSIAGLNFDGAKLAGICVYLKCASGLTFHRPHLERCWFQGYRSRGLIIGTDGTISPLMDSCTAQFQMVTCNALTFYGGTYGAVGILLNAQNCEMAVFTGLYIDPPPGDDHLHHIYQRAGGMEINGLLTSRAVGYAIMSYAQIIVNGWRTEDRYLIAMQAVDPDGPSVLSGVTQRYHDGPSGAPLYDDYTISLYHTGSAMVLSGVTIQGSVFVGQTYLRQVVASGVAFAQGGTFYYQSNTSGMINDVKAGQLSLYGHKQLFQDAAIESSLTLSPAYTNYTNSIGTIALASAGTGYQVGDLLLIKKDTEAGALHGRISVLTVDGGDGHIDTWYLVNAGTGYSVADGWETVNLTDSVNGTGATFNITALKTAWTVGCHNYLLCNSPTVVAPAAVTNAALVCFDGVAGTHKALDVGTTKTTPATVNAWVKINIAGVLYYMPVYASKTS